MLYTLLMCYVKYILDHAPRMPIAALFPIHVEYDMPD